MLVVTKNSSIETPSQTTQAFSRTALCLSALLRDNSAQMLHFMARANPTHSGLQPCLASMHTNEVLEGYRLRQPRVSNYIPAYPHQTSDNSVHPLYKLGAVRFTKGVTQSGRTFEFHDKLHDPNNVHKTLNEEMFVVQEEMSLFCALLGRSISTLDDSTTDDVGAFDGGASVVKLKRAEISNDE